MRIVSHNVGVFNPQHEATLRASALLRQLQLSGHVAPVSHSLSNSRKEARNTVELALVEVMRRARAPHRVVRRCYSTGPIFQQKHSSGYPSETQSGLFGVTYAARNLDTLFMEL